MPHAVYALVALALVSSAGIGVVLSSSDAPADLVTIEGKVTHVSWNPHFEVAVAYAISNASANATYEVELGPPWWWAEVGLPEIEVNDTLKVEGVLHDGNEIEAYRIWINGGDSIVIREGGKPPWAQVASGHDDSDSEDDA